VVCEGVVIDPDGERSARVHIENGVIERIEEKSTDKEGWILPALVDLNVSVKDERLNRKNLEDLARAAQRGGVASVVLRPDIDPPLNDEIHLEFINSHHFFCDIYGALLATKDGGMSEIATLARKYARTLFVFSDTDSYLLARIFEYAKMLRIPLFVSVRNATLRSVGVMNEGVVSFELGLGGLSKLEEYSEVAKIIEFSEFYEVEVLFQDISTARVLDLIAQSRRCHAEVPLHHLLLSDEACRGYNTLAKLLPPLRDEKERRLLLEALAQGRIDFLTSLHSPKSYTQKDLSFDEAAFGVDAISFFLPLAYTKLVKSGIVSMSRLMELLSANGAKLLGLSRGYVRPGYEARLIRFYPDRVVEGHGLYEGERLYGEVEFLQGA